MPFRIAFVPGVTPDKWSRIWQQRERGTPLELLPVEETDQISVLHEHVADMSFVRLPVEREGLHLIPLYREVPVVVVPVDHVVTAFDEVSAADLADEHRLVDPSITTRQAVETVAAGTGIVIVPMSIARLHHRKDVTYRPVTDLPESQIALAWLTGPEDPRIEAFIGIVRGRTERSSRTGSPAVPEKPAGRRRRGR
ncbi:MAG TPA: LysR substrate-binding domain-containing protein [Nocardioidaceae bacterium]|nr:LysR substrate-binding domain-containing protein [Nocardioidaceae bacterium]